MKIIQLNNLETYIEYEDLFKCHKIIKSYFEKFITNKWLTNLNIFKNDETLNIYDMFSLIYNDGLSENVYHGLFMGLDNVSRYVFYYINIEKYRIEEVNLYTQDEFINLILRKQKDKYLLRHKIPESLKQQMFEIIINHYQNKENL